MGFFDIFKKKSTTPTPQATTTEAVADAPEVKVAAEEAAREQEELKSGLEKTKTGFFSKLARAVAGRSTVDADVLDDLEEVLIRLWLMRRQYFHTAFYYLVDIFVRCRRFACELVNESVV